MNEARATFLHQIANTGMNGTGNSIFARLTSALLIGAWLLVSASSAWALDLKTVLDNTAVKPPANVSFSEQRHNPMLKEPLLLTGYLEYIKPGHLGKVIETPFNETFVVEDGKVVIQRQGKTRRLSLSKSKPLKAMLEGIEAVLAGHTEQLAEVFDYELTGDECNWILRLVPKSRKIATHLSVMTVTGTDKVTTSIRIDQGDDEWSLMSINVDKDSSCAPAT